MSAAIDVGSNTVRMLLRSPSLKGRQPEQRYYQQITRLGGGYIQGKGLAPESMKRTLAVLSGFKDILEQERASHVRLVGTAALRHAENREEFVKRVKERTGLNLEIISGREEARLSAAGILSVLNPLPEVSLLIDIGGGSTEFILCSAEQVVFQSSYPLGVVRLSEEYADKSARKVAIQQMLEQFDQDLKMAELTSSPAADWQLVGTAGTITTLAALDLQMTNYDRRQINNHVLNYAWLRQTKVYLNSLSVSAREALPGIETGRGDLILPGLEVLLQVLEHFRQTHIKVADSGLLEGVMFDLEKHSSD